EAGGRRRRGEAEAANDRDPAATGKLLRLPAPPPRSPPEAHTRPARRLPQLNPPCGAGMERGEPGRKAARSRGTVSGRPPGQGRRVSATRARLRTYQDLGNPPCSPGLRGTYTEKVRVVQRRGIRARRLPAAHPALTPARRAGHGGLGSLAGRLGSLGRAREGVFSGLSPRAPTPARARTPAHTLTRAHTRAHTRTPGRGPGRREYSMQPPHNK
ncbi:hypothetical protein EI555_004692, partial [Monodon monoceros]